MKINKIKSSITDFKTLEFNCGLNLVLGDRTFGNNTTSGHNVGKTSLIKIIEFVLFHKKDKTYFDGWLKNYEGMLFEIETEDLNNNPTIFRVPVVKKLKKDEISYNLLDTNPEMSYFIRYKSEYDNEFRRPNFRGKDITWKPFVFKILGFNSDIMYSKMQHDINLSDVDKVIKAIDKVKIEEEDKSEKIKELNNEATSIRESLKTLNFFQYDKKIINTKLNKLNIEYDKLKKDLYKLESNKSATINSLNNIQLYDFNLVEIEQIFKESNIILKEGVVKSYNELINFNKDLSISRKEMLEELLEDINNQISNTTKAINNNSNIKSKYIKLLTTTDSKEKYEKQQERLIIIEKELSILNISVMKKSKDEFINNKIELETKSIKSIDKLHNEVITKNDKFEKIQHYYNYLFKKILNVNSEIELIENKNFNIDFKTKINESEKNQLALNGEAFRRLSCGIFDLSVAGASNNQEFIVIHDGIIDGIAEPIKRKYLEVSHIFSKLNNFQYIVTGINEGIPKTISRRCIVRKLSDKNTNQLLLGAKF